MEVIYIIGVIVYTALTIGVIYAFKYVKFNAIEELKKRGNIHGDVSWLIENCEFAQTEEMVGYYKSLNPDYDDVRRLIIRCEFAQTHDMLEYYKSLEPSYKDVSWLIKDCEYAQTEEMVDYYKSLNPDMENNEEYLEAY